MLIIAGHLTVDPTERDSYVAACAPVVRAALATEGCLDFSITADTIDASRVRVYERWESEEQLLAFRGSGPSDDQQTAIIDAAVHRYIIASVEDP
ncbi:putative quinol monooxygenase [Actinospongicola halichondriae]|uniref:putative quinol monooxygenase n=1 Tax=Actinospongicola halichondriae TaxID=3236844 RepID=UPI003D5C80CA